MKHLAEHDCDDCKASETRAIHPLYRSACRGCAVRSLAASPMFHEHANTGRIGSAYGKALAAIFGDYWQAGHAIVLAEYRRQKAARGVVP